MKRVCILLLCIALCIGFCGCGQDKQESNNSEEPLQLDCKMYFTRMYDGETVLDSYEADLQATVTDHAEGKDTLDLYIDFPDSVDWTFDHENVHFTISQEDQGLSYYCAYGELYDKTVGGVFPIVLAIDFEQGYFIFKVNGNTDACTIATADPDVDPKEVHDHFQKFLELYYHPDET